MHINSVGHWVSSLYLPCLHIVIETEWKKSINWDYNNHNKSPAERGNIRPLGFLVRKETLQYFNLISN